VYLTTLGASKNLASRIFPAIAHSLSREPVTCVTESLFAHG
jgi:hypothetical protein